MLPIVDFCGMPVSRLILGGNPFSGFSHQSRERDEEMLNYYSVANLKETLARAEDAGVNTCIMRSDLHVHRLLREYRNDGGTIRWIAQVGADSGARSLKDAFGSAVRAGAAAVYLHGAHTDRHFAENDVEGLAKALADARSFGVPAGIAGHHPEAHLWAYRNRECIPVDFHVVCFYNCGSLHDGRGDKFAPEDPPRAVAAIQEIRKPCIAYKILGAGRVPAREGFEFAFRHIKAGDAVNVGMYRGDRDDMVEENAEIVSQALERLQAEPASASLPGGA